MKPEKYPQVLEILTSNKTAGYDSSADSKENPVMEVFTIDPKK